MPADRPDVGGERTRPVMRVSFTADRVNVRDLRDNGATALSFTHDEWRAFVQGVRRGDFMFGTDLSPDCDTPSLDENEP